MDLPPSSVSVGILLLPEFLGLSPLPQVHGFLRSGTMSDLALAWH